MSVIIECVGNHYDAFLQIKEMDMALAKNIKVPLVVMCFDSSDIASLMQMYPETEEGIYLTYVCLKSGVDYLVNIPYEDLLKMYLGDRKLKNFYGTSSTVQTGEDLDSDSMFTTIHEN